MVSDELEVMTGKLIYRGIEFTFVFDKKELRLIPPSQDESTIQFEWIWKSLGEGAYTLGDPLYMEEPYLQGITNETKNKIIFITRRGDTVGYNNSVLRIKIIAYIECRYEREKIDRISFSSPELNGIYPVNQSFVVQYTKEEWEKGIYSISTKNFEETTTKKQKFIAEGKTVYVCFGITRGFSLKITDSPMQIKSSLMFDFEATDDFMFAYSLWKIAREFIRFLCYRKNTWLPKAELYAPYEDGKHEAFATLYVLEQDEAVEDITISNGRYIRQKNIAGYEGKILNDLSENMIYTKHFPETYRLGRSINASRFVMITAAFEWEFRQLYPNGVEKTKKSIEIEIKAEKAIQELIENSTGKLKEKYKFLKKLIASNSLESEIIFVGKTLSDLIDVFGNHIYSINHEKLDYKEMGRRIATQRNNFAHGNLDKDFIGKALLDLIFMEYIIYAMQLQRMGIDNENIQRAINDLFHCGLAL